MPKKIGLFRRIGIFIAATFTTLFGKAKKAAVKYIPVGIEVVQKIKEVVDSPLTPLVTSLIPGTLDDAIAGKVKQVLPQVLATLKITNECAKKGTNDEVIQCAIAYLRTLRPDGQRHDLWLKIAAKLSAALSDGKLEWTEILSITQDVYDNQYK